MLNRIGFGGQSYKDKLLSEKRSQTGGGKKWTHKWGYTGKEVTTAKN